MRIGRLSAQHLLGRYWNGILILVFLPVTTTPPYRGTRIQEDILQESRLGVKSIRSLPFGSNLRIELIIIKSLHSFLGLLSISSDLHHKETVNVDREIQG